MNGSKAKYHYDAGESSEWYTPAEYIEAARATMGAIDLDPASCEFANRVIQAATFYDRFVDGLHQQWRGRVWLNPPYSDYPGQEAKWADKLLYEYCEGRVNQAVMLVNLSTAYQPVMQVLAGEGMVCLVAKPIRFYNAQGDSQSSPTQANMFFYLGERRQQFCQHFGPFGVCK